MVTTKRNLLLLVVTLAVAGVAAAQERSPARAFPDVNAEALQDEGLLDGKRDKRTLLLGAGLGFGKGFLLGKAAGLALGKGYSYYPTGGYNYYPQYRAGYNPHQNDYYDYPGGGPYGGGYAGANSQAHTTSITGGLGPFYAGFSTSDAAAGSYGYGR